MSGWVQCDEGCHTFNIYSDSPLGLPSTLSSSTLSSPDSSTRTPDHSVTPRHVRQRGSSAPSTTLLLLFLEDTVPRCKPRSPARQPAWRHRAEQSGPMRRGGAHTCTPLPKLPLVAPWWGVMEGSGPNTNSGCLSLPRHGSGR